MDFMANTMACRVHAGAFYDALRVHVDGLPAKGEHFAFRVSVGGGYLVSLSIVPDANPGGAFEVVETLVFGPDGQAIYDLPEEFEYGGDVRRFCVGEGDHVHYGDHVVAVAAHIKALREHFGYNAAGGAAAASPNQNSDQDSDQDQEVVSEEIIKKIQEIIRKQLETLRKLLRVDHREDIQELIGERLRAAQRHRAEIEARAVEREAEATRQRAEHFKKIMQGQKLVVEQIIARLQRASEERDRDTKYLWTQLDALRGSRNRMTDEMRAMSEQMRAMKELLRTQQQQMSEMHQKFALLEAKTSK